MFKVKGLKRERMLEAYSVSWTYSVQGGAEEKFLVGTCHLCVPA